MLIDYGADPYANSASNISCLEVCRFAATITFITMNDDICNSATTTTTTCRYK